jgi:hypothetical protein
MERLRQEIALMKDELLTDEERVGLDFIRNDEDLELAIKFQLEVYYEGKTEAVWAAETSARVRTVTENRRNSTSDEDQRDLKTPVVRTGSR